MKTTLYADIREILLTLSDEALDPWAKDKMRAWGDPPSALQILEVLDMCANGSLTSDLVMTALDMLLTEAVTHEGITRQDVIAKASWRKSASAP